MKSGKFLRGFLKPESHKILYRRRGEDGIKQTQTGAWADAGAFCYFLQSDGGIIILLDENQRLFDAKLVPLVLAGIEKFILHIVKMARQMRERLA